MHRFWPPNSTRAWSDSRKIHWNAEKRLSLYRVEPRGLVKAGAWSNDAIQPWSVELMKKVAGAQRAQNPQMSPIGSICVCVCVCVCMCVCVGVCMFEILFLSAI